MYYTFNDYLHDFRKYLRWHILMCQVAEANFGWFDTIDKMKTFVPNKKLHLNKWAEGVYTHSAFTSDIDEDIVTSIMLLNVDDKWKILLLLGIGAFSQQKENDYNEVMKKLADSQKLYLIIADSDYIYGVNYQFCHGYLSKDLNLTFEKIIQSLGRIGRNNIQQDYTIRFRNNEHINILFYKNKSTIESFNMNKLFSSSSSSSSPSSPSSLIIG